MTEDQVRALLLCAAKPFASKRIGAVGLTNWAKHHGVPPSRCSEFLNGKRKPTKAMLEALGLEWRICRKPKATT